METQAGMKKLEQEASPELLRALFARAPEIIQRYGCDNRLYERIQASFSHVCNGVGELSLHETKLLLGFYSWDHPRGQLEWEIDESGNVLQGVDRSRGGQAEPPSETLVQGVLGYFEKRDQQRQPAPAELLRELFRYNAAHSNFSLNNVPTSGSGSISFLPDGNLYLRVLVGGDPLGWWISPDGKVIRGKTSWWDDGSGYFGSSGVEGGGTAEIGPPNEALIRDILAEWKIKGYYTEVGPKGPQVVKLPPDDHVLAIWRRIVDSMGELIAALKPSKA